MNKLKYTVVLFLVCILFGHTPLIASSAKKSSTVKVKKEIKVDTVDTIKKRADQEIERRVVALNKITSRIESMRWVSDSTKEILNKTAKEQITTLSELKIKIDSETDITALKTEFKSINDSYRIFMLIMPQISIHASADRIKTVADTMTALSIKLQSRLDIANAAGKNVSSLQTSLDDMNAKIKNAKELVDIAISEIPSLISDEDKAKVGTNKKALQSARAKIKTSIQDLKTARQDAGDILEGLRAFGFKYERKDIATTTIE